MQRRSLLLGAAALAGCRRPASPPLPALPAPPFRLAPVRASLDRLFRITVCSRPFRAAGPRVEVERVGEHTVVHNYGHGGSGWSLSWGSSRMAADLALATGEREIAVIGCGALGLTSALLLQQSGRRVTIYAKDRPSDTRSARATGSWTPDSRIALTSKVDADFGARWERMARFSYTRYQSYLGSPGAPVEWIDRYFTSDLSPEEDRANRRRADRLGFARYQDRLADLTPASRTLEPGQHPFPTRYASHGASLTFHLAVLARQLMADFLLEGGRFEIAEFHTPGDLARLRQKTIVHCTGYGARALFGDQSIIPVRGQIAWLMPQPEVNYSVFHQGVLMLSRRDGIVVQEAAGEEEGYDNANEEPDCAQAERAIGVIAGLYARMRA